MDTKWKNIKSKAKSFLEKCWLSSTGIAVKLFCFVLAGFGIAFWYSVVVYRTYHPTGESLFFGILGNALFGAGQMILTAFLIMRKFREWDPGEKDAYVKWQNRWKIRNRRLQWIGGTALLIALWYMSYLMNGGMYIGTGWQYNYASGYVMILSALVQFVLAGAVMNHFKKKQLDMIMCNFEKINQNRIKEALEIERKSLEKVSRSDQLRVDLITNVSHDLKTPLTAITTYIELLKKEDITEEERKSYIETLEKKSLRLKVLIEDLFEVSKATTNNITLNLMDVDVVNLMKQVSVEHADKFEKMGMQLRWNVPEEKVILQLDNQKTYRIFENLFVNIQKYAMPNSRVYIDVEKSETDVTVTMRNMSAVELHTSGDELAERFVRGDASRNTEGSGLGLAIARSFTEAQKGSLHISVDGDLFKVVILWKLS